MKRHSKKGVTLLEVVIVLALAGILAAVAVPVTFGSLSGVKARACRGSRESIYTYFVMEEKLNGNRQTLAEVIARCLSGADDDAVEPCPEGGSYTASEGDKSVVCSIHGAE